MILGCEYFLDSLLCDSKFYMVGQNKAREDHLELWESQFFF